MPFIKKLPEPHWCSPPTRGDNGEHIVNGDMWYCRACWRVWEFDGAAITSIYSHNYVNGGEWTTRNLWWDAEHESMVDYPITTPGNYEKEIPPRPPVSEHILKDIERRQQQQREWWKHIW